MITLEAKEGYVYSNGEVYGQTVYLSDLDSPDNWKEMSIEEAEQLEHSEKGAEIE